MNWSSFFTYFIVRYIWEKGNRGTISLCVDVWRWALSRAHILPRTITMKFHVALNTSTDRFAGSLVFSILLLSEAVHERKSDPIAKYWLCKCERCWTFFVSMNTKMIHIMLYTNYFLNYASWWDGVVAVF